MSFAETIAARIEAEKENLERKLYLEEVDRLEGELRTAKSAYDEAYNAALEKGYIEEDTVEEVAPEAAPEVAEEVTEEEAPSEEQTEEVTEEVTTPSEEINPPNY